MESRYPNRALLLIGKEPAVPPQLDQSVAASTAGLLALAVLLSLPVWIQPFTLEGPLGAEWSSPSVEHSVPVEGTMKEPMALDPVAFGTAAERRPERARPSSR